MFRVCYTSRVGIGLLLVVLVVLLALVALVRCWCCLPAAAAAAAAAAATATAEITIHQLSYQVPLNGSFCLPGLRAAGPARRKPERKIDTDVAYAHASSEADPRDGSCLLQAVCHTYYLLRHLVSNSLHHPFVLVPEHNYPQKQHQLSTENVCAESVPFWYTPTYSSDAPGKRRWGCLLPAIT